MPTRQTPGDKGEKDLIQTDPTHTPPFCLNLLTWPSLSLMTISTGVSWPCIALYSVLMLMPCFVVPKASVHG